MLVTPIALPHTSGFFCVRHMVRGSPITIPKPPVEVSGTRSDPKNYGESKGKERMMFYFYLF